MKILMIQTITLFVATTSFAQSSENTNYREELSSIETNIAPSVEVPAAERNPTSEASPTQNQIPAEKSKAKTKEAQERYEYYLKEIEKI